MRAGQLASPAGPPLVNCFWALDGDSTPSRVTRCLPVSAPVVRTVFCWGLLHVVRMNVSIWGRFLPAKFRDGEQDSRGCFFSPSLFWICIWVKLALGEAF